MREAFHDELDQLHLQVEVMAARVEENLARMRRVVREGDRAAAADAVAADDAIDAINVSLTQRCYELLVRETPVANDLRFVVSVLRILGELERTGDLTLRVAKRVEDQPLIAAHGDLFAVACDMCDQAVDRFGAAVRAWAGLDLEAATALATTNAGLEPCLSDFAEDLTELRGPDAARVAVAALVVAQSLDRIADHATVIGARIRYLLTGDPSHLAAEVA